VLSWGDDGFYGEGWTQLSDAVADIVGEASPPPDDAKILMLLLTSVVFLIISVAILLPPCLI
jgi:hypothetical protein